MDGKAYGMAQYPRVTVIMPVYNGSAFLKEAVDSILVQTFFDFELIIIDDGSNDQATLDILRSMSDKRVRILTNDKNRGITWSLIRGVEEATGDLIARMDADDISFPTRLEKQVVYMDAHPEIGLLGTSCYYISTTGRIIKKKIMPASDFYIRWTSFFENPIIHPSSMFRRSLLKKYSINYNQDFPIAQDYDLWQRLLSVTKAANLIEPLISYRMLKQSAGSQKRERQLYLHMKVAERALECQLFYEKINRDVYLDLIPLVAGFRYRKNSNASYIDLINLYLDMWQLFKGQFSNMKEMNNVQRLVVTKAAWMAFRNLEREGIVQLIVRFFRMNPGWIFELLLRTSSIFQTFGLLLYRKSAGIGSNSNGKIL